MIYSMTGFGRSHTESPEVGMTIELKTVNHKFIDFQIKMPSYLNFMEEDIKRELKSKISRGRIELYIKNNIRNRSTSEIIFDIPLATEIKNRADELQSSLGMEKGITMSDLLGVEGVLSVNYDKIDEEFFRRNILEGLREAIGSLLDMREKEGESIFNDFIYQINEIKRYLELIKYRAPEYVSEQRQRITDRIRAIIDSDRIDLDRLNMEIVIFSEKADITEEIVRLESHISQFLYSIEINGPIGRKLDFIVQEMNREINTISSKSNDNQLTEYVIEMKTTLEKLREQIQNIE